MEDLGDLINNILKGIPKLDENQGELDVNEDEDEENFMEGGDQWAEDEAIMTIPLEVRVLRKFIRDGRQMFGHYFRAAETEEILDWCDNLEIKLEEPSVEEAIQKLALYYFINLDPVPFDVIILRKKAEAIMKFYLELFLMCRNK